MIFEMNDINHNRSEDSSQPLVAETQVSVTHHHHLDEEELSSSSSLDAFSSMSPILGFSLPTIIDHDSSVVTTTTTTSESALNASTMPATTTNGVYEFVNPAYLSSTDFLPATAVNKHRSREEPTTRHHITGPTSSHHNHRINHHTKSHHHANNVNSSKIKATTGVLWPSSTNATAKPLKCICKNNEKHFKCFSCTQNYPISVRRSKDDEASTIAAAATAVSAANQLNKQQKRAKERMEFEARFNNNSMQHGTSGGVNKSQHHNQQQQQAAALTSQSYSESSSIESHTSSSLSSSSSSSSDSNVYDATILKLKPSPIPISSTLIALLALTNPGNNKFRPPPNVNLAHHVNHQSHVDKK